MDWYNAAAVVQRRQTSTYELKHRRQDLESRIQLLSQKWSTVAFTTRQKNRVIDHPSTVTLNERKKLKDAFDSSSDRARERYSAGLALVRTARYLLRLDERSAMFLPSVAVRLSRPSRSVNKTSATVTHFSHQVYEGGYNGPSLSHTDTGVNDSMHTPVRNGDRMTFKDDKESHTYLDSLLTSTHLDGDDYLNGKHSRWSYLERNEIRQSLTPDKMNENNIHNDDHDELPLTMKDLMSPEKQIMTDSIQYRSSHSDDDHEHTMSDWSLGVSAENE